MAFQSHAEFGFFHVPNQGGWSEDGWATINGLGFRGAPPDMPKRPGSFRILIAGDSTTFGWGVNDHETYSVALEQLLRQAAPDADVRVINAGVSGFNLKQTARLIGHFAPRLEPDLVLVGLFWNDLPFHRSTPDGVPMPVAPATPASTRQAGVFHITGQPTGLRAVLRSSRALMLARHAWSNAIENTTRADNAVQWEMALLHGRQTDAIDQAWSEVAQLMSDIKTAAAEAGSDVGVVIIPMRAQVERPFPASTYQTRAAAIARSLGMFVIDPLPALRAHPTHRDLYIPYDRMHMTATGHGLLAHAILDTLRDRPPLMPR